MQFKILFMGEFGSICVKYEFNLLERFVAIITKFHKIIKFREL